MKGASCFFMDMKELLTFLQEEKIDYMENEKLSKHTSFKIGGPCKLLLLPKNKEEIQKLVKNLKDTAYFVLGNGSNVLFRDEGFDGVVLKLASNFSSYRIEGSKVICDAGMDLSVLARKTALKSLGGLEFASGIPGTVGGGVIMNAGAYDGELKDVVSSVLLLDGQGNYLRKSGEEMEFSYRSSLAQKEKYLVVEVAMELAPGSYEEIWAKIDDFTIRRWTKQPLEFPSGGSTFKRPEGYFAGKLIQDAGLKGMRFRGAQVSTKHSGFIVNLGHASCDDVRTLIRIVQRRVKEEFGVELATELRLIDE